MKVLHILHKLKIGGAEAAAVSCLRFMNNTDSFYIVFIDKFDEIEYSKIAPELQKQIYSLGRKNKYQYMTIIFKIITIIRNEKPDIIISSLWKSSLLALLVRVFFKLKWITFIHNTRFPHIIDKFITILAVKMCDYVFTDSQATGIFINGFCRKNFSVISFLLDKHSGKVNVTKTKSDTFRFVFTGRLSRVKRLDKCVDLVKKLTEQGINVVFDIYGTDEGILIPLLRQIDSLELSKVVFYKGTLMPEEVKPILLDYDFYLQLSDYEGMAISVVDAMQVGLVCIVTKVGAIKDYSVDMVSALHYEGDKANQIESTVQKILSVIDDPLKYDKISKSATKVFENYKTYGESLYENLKLV